MTIVICILGVTTCTLILICCMLYTKVRTTQLRLSKAEDFIVDEVGELWRNIATICEILDPTLAKTKTKQSNKTIH